MKFFVHGKDVHGADFRKELEVAPGQFLGFDANGIPVATNSMAKVRLEQETVAYAANVALDCDGRAWRLITLAGNITFDPLLNKGEAKEFSVRIKSDGSTRNLSFPASWVFTGTKPTNIAATKTGILVLRCFGASESDVVVNYSVEA